MREKILLGGGTNSGKTIAIIQLAVMFPGKKIYAFDAEGDINLTLEDMGLELPNLIVKEVTPDWEQLMKDYHEAKTVLTANDWCCFDMLGVFWDLAQEAFAQIGLGQSMAERQLTIIKERGKVSFAGFDGLDHWPTIKKMHNTDLLDNAVRWSPFNVLATTSLKDFSPKEKLPKTGVEGLMAKEFGQKLNGEKHNKFRFRNIAILYQNIDNGRFYFKLVKLKGTALKSPLKEIDMTGRSFFEVYAEHRGLEL